MPGNYVITNRADGEGINAVKYMADHQQHVDNLEPPKIDDYSSSVTEMRSTVDPGEVGSESQATSLAGELERIRYAIKEIKGTAQWYETPPFTLASGAFPAGTRLLFDNAAAPAGWTRVTDIDDRVVTILGAGAPANGGAWTITGLTQQAHQHYYSASGSTGTETGGPGPNVQSSGEPYPLVPPWGHAHSFSVAGWTNTASATGVSHDGSWRPAYRGMILCQKG